MDQVMTGATEMSAIVPEVWSAAIYPTLLAKLPFNESVSRDYEGEIQQLGDTVNISSIPEFDEGQELAEDEKADAEAVTISGQQLVINKQVVKDFIVTSKAMRQSISVMDKLREKAIYSVMKKMQSIIIAEIVPNASAPDHSIAYDSGTTLALADILEGKELLDDQDVSELGRQMILGTAAQNDLYNITGFISRDFIPAGSPLTSGQFQTPILGFEVKTSSVVGTVSYLFHPSFLTLAVQRRPEVEVFNLGGEGKRAQRVNVTTLFGVKQLDDLRVVTIS